MAAAHGGNKLSHLIFVDDNILFCNATLEDWTKIKSILNKYERASAQMINEQKSSLIFSSNTAIAVDTNSPENRRPHQ